MTIGSLCSGFGGLDLAAETLTGGTTVWHCEYDDAPSKVLAARWPGVPNHRDLTTLAWADHPVDVLTAGYPCQPFSGAGKRLGTDDPRHLFPWIARGVERMRPPLLLLENVRGHLSLGFDVVLAELDRIGYDARWTLLRAADVGACHGRARLFIAARDRQAGGWPVMPGEPSAVCEDGGWVRAQGGLFGSVEADKPGPAGVMVGGARWDGAVREHLLPTPAASDAVGARNSTSGRQEGSQHHSGDTLGDLVHDGRLLPTPAVNDMGAGKTVEAWDAWTEAQRQKHGNGNGHGPSLHIEAARMAMLPTPRATDGTKGGPNQAGSSGDLMLPSAVQPSRWGVYAAAVARAEVACGRPAPDPTEPGRNGQPRLSPRFVEWMQMLPDGWVTDVLGRNPALKALGNGVVPAQALAAFSLLLADVQAVAA